MKMNLFSKKSKKSQAAPSRRNDMYYMNTDWMLSHPYVDKQAVHPNNNKYAYPEPFVPRGEQHTFNTNWMMSHPYVDKKAVYAEDDDTVDSAEQ